MERWNALQVRANTHCAVRGSKRRLCESLGVRPAAVSKLLNSKVSQPRAEIALKLLAWVEAKDRELILAPAPLPQGTQNTALAHDPAEMAEAATGI